MHVRDNHEIFASLVAFRTSSSFARCFLNEWIELGTTQTNSNFDNGDLHHLLLGLVNQTVMHQCATVRGTNIRFYANHYIACFFQFYSLFERNKQRLRLPIQLYYPLQVQQYNVILPLYHMLYLPHNPL